MVDQHTVVAAYNATDEAADGLALARLLGGLQHDDPTLGEQRRADELGQLRPGQVGDFRAPRGRGRRRRAPAARPPAHAGG